MPIHGPPSDIAVLFTHDCCVLKSSFISCDFNFIKHDCNQATHTCAQKVLFNGLSSLWTSILLPWGFLLSHV
ncbi:hypothetical protein RHMOL_Rhmol04G0268700 [Rhododendron molle]|uniref:Uncharacterized protein n=1 Tax=Rhododendron molle TaxID=49168 RepID=A0ACC0P5T2_RHOML|nr:hypothetical protein RHMOL_Rhmol04G0268700 [Rhododendron molle]